MASTVPHSALTLMILGLNSALDTGKYDGISIEEVTTRIDDGTLLKWLKERLGRDIDLSLHLGGTYGDFDKWYVGYLQSIQDAYGGKEARKWGVSNRGLCLLIAWTNEIIQQGRGWTPNENIARR